MFMSRVRHLLSRVPILGAPFHCTSSQLLSALVEFFVVLVFATATFWVTAFIQSFLSANDDKGFFQLLADTTKRGELYIFATALLGPILVHLGDDSEHLRAFPSRLWFMLFLVVGGMVCAAPYALLRVASTPGVTMALNIDWILFFSVIIGSVALVVRFSAIAGSKSRASAEDLFKQKEIDFADQFAERAKVSQ
jgi:hypothetical protein